MCKSLVVSKAQGPVRTTLFSRNENRVKLNRVRVGWVSVSERSGDWGRGYGGRRHGSHQGPNLPAKKGKLSDLTGGQWGAMEDHRQRKDMVK